jgi:hypothetical protein
MSAARRQPAPALLVLMPASSVPMAWVPMVSGPLSVSMAAIRSRSNRRASSPTAAKFEKLPQILATQVRSMRSAPPHTSSVPKLAPPRGEAAAPAVYYEAP